MEINKSDLWYDNYNTWYVMQDFQSNIHLVWGGIQRPLVICSDLAERVLRFIS